MRSGLERRDSDHRRLEGLDAPSDIGLERKYDFRSDRNRIDGVVRLSRVSGAPSDNNPERARPGHNRSGTAKDRAARLPWRDVNSKCGVGGTVAVEQTFLDHQSCPGVS